MAELQLQSTPATLGFNFTELMEWATGITADYEGLVVTEDMVPGIKSEMAGLNKMKAQLDSARKQAVRQVSEPIRQFEARIKEVCAVFDAAYAALATQVKGVEERQREEKRREVLFLIADTVDEHGVPGLEVAVQDSWLNKSKPLKAIKAEVESIILRHLQEERERAALEQAKQDRAVAIEQMVAAQGQAYGFALPASDFLRLHDLQIPLTDVHAEIEKVFAARAQFARHAASASPVPAVAVQAARPSASSVVSGRPQRKTLTIQIEYDAMREPAVQQTLRHLKGMCASFNLIPGQSAA